MGNMKSLKHLFENNQKWVASKTEKDPQFFSSMAEDQIPLALWIGCSDSRVPANEIVGLPSLTVIIPVESGITPCEAVAAMLPDVGALAGAKTKELPVLLIVSSVPVLVQSTDSSVR